MKMIILNDGNDLLNDRDAILIRDNIRKMIPIYIDKFNEIYKSIHDKNIEVIIEVAEKGLRNFREKLEMPIQDNFNVKRSDDVQLYFSTGSNIVNHDLIFGVKIDRQQSNERSIEKSASIIKSYDNSKTTIYIDIEASDTENLDCRLYAYDLVDSTSGKTLYTGLINIYA